MAKSGNQLLTFVFLLLALSVTAQCPDRAKVVSGLDAIAADKDRLKAVSDLDELAEIWRKCNAAADSANALQSIETRSDRSAILVKISGIYKKLGDYEKAVQYNQLALVTRLGYFKNEDPQSNPRSLNLQNTVDKADILTLIRDKAETWLEYGRRGGNDPARLQNALNAFMLADTMIGFMRREQTGAAPKMFWSGKTRRLYEQAIETCLLLNDPDKAFLLFEKSKAAKLNDQLDELSGTQLLSPEDQKKEAALTKKLTALQIELAEHEHDRALSGELSSKLFTANQERERFIDNLQNSNPQYFAYKYDIRTADVETVRKHVLGENQSFVSYFAGDSALYGLLLSDSKVILKKLDLGRFLSLTIGFQKLVADREMQNRRFKEYLSISNELYLLLLKPFDILQNTRIIVSADGSFFPFQALSFSPEKPDYLVRRYAFSYAYSASVLAKSRRAGNLNLFTKSFFGMAPVQFNPALNQPKLPDSDQALKVIGDRFFYATMLTGPDASKKAFLEQSPDYRIVQLLTHATADADGSTPTLYFADSAVKINELVPQSRSATELLVLSACQTSVGKNQRGEGVFSLARGFAGMGIPSTITTLWNVENQSVQKLTDMMYIEFEKGLPLDVALQNAQAKWLENASAGEGLPYSWAGIVLVGNSTPVETGIPRSVGFVIAGALLILAVFLYYYFNRRKTAIHS